VSIDTQQTGKETTQEQTEEQRSNERWRQLLETALNPFPQYRSMRESNPVFYNEENKFWEVFRYDDVLHIITDYVTFSSERVVSSDQAAMERLRKEGWSEDDLPTQSILSLDPPRHRQLRSLITQAFTPRAVAQLTPRITEIVNDLLDKVAATGQMDIIQDLSYPLPVIVIAEMLGVPIEEHAQFKRWSDAILDPSEDVRMQSVKEMNAYFRHILAQRRVDPKDDLISGLVAAEVNGEKLSERELLSFCVILLIAGNITTTNLIGNAILCFDEHPEVMDQLREDLSLLPNAIEEVLRYRSPVQRLVRAATIDTVIGGKQIKAGELILPCLGSANRDEEQFPDPDVFDIRRTPNRHVAFGHGIHFCIGAPLARLETRIAFEVMLQRFSEIERVHEIPLEPVAGFYGVKSLPITFEVRAS
jgi:cytochrome P450